MSYGHLDDCNNQTTQAKSSHINNEPYFLIDTCSTRLYGVTFSTEPAVSLSFSQTARSRSALSSSLPPHPELRCRPCIWHTPPDGLRVCSGHTLVNMEGERRRKSRESDGWVGRTIEKGRVLAFTGGKHWRGLKRGWILLLAKLIPKIWAVYYSPLQR